MTGIAVILAALVVATLGWFLWEKGRRKTRSMPAGLQQQIQLPHTQQWALYHNAFSLCSKKIRVCLAEYDVPYENNPIDLIETGRYQNISRTFLQVNPAATVPVLLHNGHPIYESHEQLKYVAEQVDQRGLLVPQDAEQKQVMDAWVHRTSLVGDDPISSPNATAGNAVPGLTVPIFASMVATIPTYRILEGLLFHRIKQRAVFFLVMKLAGLRGTLKPKPVNQIINKAAAAMAEHLDALDQQLQVGGGPWICGAQFTLADVGMMVILDRLREGDWQGAFLTQRPRVQQYWDALQQRDSYRVACQDFQHAGVIAATHAIAGLKANGQWPETIPC